VKLPQIVKLLQSGSADSIAPSMFVLENIGYTVSWAYNHRHGYPFSTYGETVFLLLQGFVLVFLVFRINGRLNAAFAAATAAYVAFALALFTVVPDSALSALQSLSIPLFAASRLPQIASNWRHGSTGQLAFLTTLLNALGSLARVFTTVQEVNDPIMLTGVCISTLLNGLLLLQMLYYWHSSSKQAGGKAALTPATGTIAAKQQATVETRSTTVTEEAKPVKRRSKRVD
jgi:mannose-P-dolichol utilization defect protein 1